MTTTTKTVAAIPTPEWIRPAQARLQFGIRKGKVYDLIKKGVIRSKLITEPGNARGIRLIDAQSLRDYINSFPDAS